MRMNLSSLTPKVPLPQLLFYLAKQRGKKILTWKVIFILLFACFPKFPAVSLSARLFVPLSFKNMFYTPLIVFDSYFHLPK